MTYDPSTGDLVLFGGTTGAYGAGPGLADTWLWNGSSWSQSPATGPSARFGAAMHFDPAVGGPVLFGGGDSYGSSTMPDDTWVFTGTSWIEQSPSSPPQARFSPAMTYDTAASQQLMFGGLSDAGQALGGTYAYATDVPASPGEVSATSGNGDVSLAWSAPAADGGSTVTGYDIYEGTAPGAESATPVNASPLSPSATSYTATGLSNGTTYYFTIEAVNANGSSIPSAQVAATPEPPAPSATTPSAPQSLSATPGDAQVSLAWEPPSSDGGIAITGYDVYEGTAPGAESTTPVNASPLAPSATSYTVTGLTNGTTYYFTLRALNAVGASPASNEASATLTATVPAKAGYWEVASNGAIYSFGSAGFYGSLPGLKISVSDVTDIAPSADGGGYHLLSSDGGIFSFGDTGYHGSLPGLGVSVNDVAGMAPTPTGGGYWEVSSDGGIFSFGNAAYEGSLPGLGISVNDVVGMAKS